MRQTEWKLGECGENKQVSGITGVEKSSEGEQTKKSRLGEATEQVSMAGLEKQNRDKVNDEQILKAYKILNTNTKSAE